MAGLAKVVSACAIVVWLAAPLTAASPTAPGGDDAERLLERIIAEQRQQQARDRAEADRLVSAALQFFKQGNYTSARETVERALRLDPGNAGGRKLLASVRARLAPPAVTPAARTVTPRQVEAELQVALLEGRRLLADGQGLAAIEVLENAERAIAMTPTAVNLAPYRAETIAALAAARAAIKAEPAPVDVVPLNVSRTPTVPTPLNPGGTRRPGELGPVPRPTVSETERRMITRDDARFWAKPSTYLEEYDFAAAELAVRPIGPTPLIRYPADWKQKSERRIAEARGWSKGYRELKAKLDRTLDSKVDFKGVTLTQALGFLRDLTDVSMVIDPAVSAAGLDKKKITFEVGRVKLASALNLVAEITGTAYVLRNEVVWFTTPARAKTYKVVKVYNISDLTMPLRNNLEWRPLKPPEDWEANPRWDRYIDWWERWGGSGDRGGYVPGRASHYPPFWPSHNKDGDSREERAERIYDMIDRLLGSAERE